jgi:hypothetical protein
VSQLFVSSNTNCLKQFGDTSDFQAGCSEFATLEDRAKRPVASQKDAMTTEPKAFGLSNIILHNLLFTPQYHFRQL